MKESNTSRHLWGHIDLRQIFLFALASTLFLTFAISDLKGQGKELRQVPSYDRVEMLPDDHPLAYEWVMDVAQDRQGFLWIASSGGLFKFDGYEYTRYRSHSSDTTKLVHDNVFEVLEDENENVLWLGTMEGFSRLDLNTETFKNYHDYRQYLPDQHRSIFEIIQDKNGKIWLGCQSGVLLKFDPQTEQFKQISMEGVTCGGGWGIWNFGIDKKGDLWGTCNGYVFRIHPESEEVTPFEDRIPNGSLAMNPKNGFPCFINDKRILTYDVDKDSIITYPIDIEALSNKFVNGRNLHGFYVDRQGKFWLSNFAWGDLFRIDPETRELSTFPAINQKKKKPAISLVFEARDGTIWLGSWKGLGYIDPYLHRLSFVEDLDYPERFSHIGAFNKDNEDNDGNIWFSPLGYGLTRFNPRSGEVKTFLPFPEKLYDENLTNEVRIQAMLPNDQILGERGRGNYLLFDIRTSGFLPAPPMAALFGFPPDYQFSSYLHKRKKIVLEKEGSEYLFDPLAKQITPVVPGSFAHLKVIDKIIDQTKYSWYSLDTGLLQVNNQTGAQRFSSYNPFLFNPNDPRTMSGERIKAVLEDSQGNLWLGLEYRGLSRLIWPEGTNEKPYFIRYRQDNSGLLSDDIASLIEDHNGHIWISMQVGISRLDPETEEFMNFSIPETGQPFYRWQQALRSKTDHIYFAGLKGLTFFHPDNIWIDTLKPEVVITDFSVNNHPVPIRHTTADSMAGGSPLLQHINFTRSITLSYAQNNFSFSFAALDFSLPGRNRYAYQLEGYHDDWIFVNADQRRATFTNIPPGDYTFRVKGSNADGIWNEAGTSIRLNITPPWWLTNLAKLIYGLLGILAIWSLIRWRTNRQQQKIARQEKELEQEKQVNERLLELDKLKDQFLANTSHELRTPLHGIVGIAESIFDNSEQRSPEELRENLGMIVASGRRLSSLVNDLLDFSRAKNKDLRIQQKSLDLRTITDVVLRSCQPLVGLSPIELKNEIPEDLPPVLADENRLQQIFYNLVGNAIKFTQKGQVSIGARQKDGMAEISVKDTGIGIPADKQESIFRSFEQVEGAAAREYGGTGLGLSITKQLVELHGGRIWVESAPGRGSDFCFTLPVSGQPTQLTTDGAALTPISTKSLPTVAEAIEQKTPLVTDPKKGLKVLIVDDEPINHQVIRNYLAGQDFLLTSVMNGTDALETIESGKKYDLVLLDVMMPRMSGYEVCQQIREQYLPSELPIVMVTAKNQIQDLVQGLTLGANDYLSKPFSKDEFLARVKTQINLHRINDATAKFVPAAFLRSIGRDNITQVQLGDHIQRDVTVLFSDIRDYTSLAETMTPAENFKFINDFNGRMGPIVHQHGGFINQYLGDSIMAIFEQPDQALKAAVDMQRQLRSFNRELREQKKAQVNVGIGFHTGPLIMGITGDEKRMDAATISDTVNTASRIENLTKFFGVNILLTDESLNHLQNTVGEEAFSIRYLGKVQVKGKVEPTGIYECFDGDPEELIVAKRETKALFDLGIEQFLAGEFSEAQVLFNRILKDHPRDSATHYFYRRSAEYVLNGIPDGWNGVQVLTTQ